MQSDQKQSNDQFELDKEQFYQQLKYEFEFEVVRKDPDFLLTVNAVDDLRRILAKKLSDIGSTPDHLVQRLKDVIECINVHTSKLHAKNIFDNIDETVNVFKSPCSDVLGKEIKKLAGFKYLCDIDPEFEDMIKYCKEKAKKDLADIFERIENEIFTANREYDNFVNGLVNILIDKNMSNDEKITRITRILACRTSLNVTRYSKRKFNLC